MSKCECGNEPGLTREKFIESCAKAWDDMVNKPPRSKESQGKVLFITAVVEPGTRPDIYRTALGGADVRTGLYNIASEAMNVGMISPALDPTMRAVVAPIMPILFPALAPDRN